MKQILQMLGSGETLVEEVPEPALKKGHVLIRSSLSLVSAGTERMLVEFGKANLFQKARQQPEKVKEVIAKARTDGLSATYEAVRSKLDQPLALGYSNVGVVVDVCSSVDGIKVGDRVVSNSSHAGTVVASMNLCETVPAVVSDESAAFAVVAAIGLQGIRLADPKLGECVAVTGLGLIGLLTVQMLVGQGCRVLALDFDSERLALAASFGAEVIDLSKVKDPIPLANQFSRGRGVDAVLICAATTSNEPIKQAATMSRKRGKIVLVGVTGLELSRADFYEKELSFQVSCSYGPGRYDSAYEEHGQDYPVAYVRWTEKRNFEAVLDLMASGVINVGSLVSHRFSIDAAEEAYQLLSENKSSLGILIDYGVDQRDEKQSIPLAQSSGPGNTGNRVAVIGAGNYAGRVLIPAFQSAGANLHTLVSSGGVSSVVSGKKFGFSVATTDVACAIDNSDIDTVVIATRHDSHAELVLNALQAGKNVFVEKPLCLSLQQLEAISAIASDRPELRLMIGFNRRFSPLVVKVKDLLRNENFPKHLVMTVNAGAIPPDHWTQDVKIGGGRIVGEGCHFIDLLRFVTGSPIQTHSVASMAGTSSPVRDTVSLALGFEDGSVGTIHYVSVGHNAYPKERLEVFCNGRILQIDNFRRLNAWGWPSFSGMKLWRQDKGQNNCVKAFLQAVEGNEPDPISLEEIIEVSRISILAQEAVT